MQIPDLICDVRPAPEQDGLFTQDDVAAGSVYVECHAGHAGQGGEFLGQIIGVGEVFPIDDQADHDLTALETVADQHVADKPFPGSFVVWGDAALFHVCDHHVQDLAILGNAQEAVPVGDDLVGAPGVKACNDAAVFIESDRELGFVAVVERVVHAHDGFHGKVCAASDVFQVPAYQFFFKKELLGIGEGLQLAAAALPGESAGGIRTVCRGREDLHQPRIAIAALGFDDLGLHRIADDGVFDEEGVAVHAADTFPVLAHVFDGRCDQLVFVKFHKDLRGFFLLKMGLYADVCGRAEVFTVKVPTSGRTLGKLVCTLGRPLDGLERGRARGTKRPTFTDGGCLHQRTSQF